MTVTRPSLTGSMSSSLLHRVGASRAICLLVVLLLMFTLEECLFSRRNSPSKSNENSLTTSLAPGHVFIDGSWSSLRADYGLVPLPRMVAIRNNPSKTDIKLALNDDDSALVGPAAELRVVLRRNERVRRPAAFKSRYEYTQQEFATPQELYFTSDALQQQIFTTEQLKIAIRKAKAASVTTGKLIGAASSNEDRHKRLQQLKNNATPRRQRGAPIRGAS